MKKLDLATARQTFTQLFKAAKTDMFKAEVLQDYSAIDDSPSLRAWLAGQTAESRRLGKTDQGIAAWRAQCLASPASITRVHVVAEPFTPYLSWEIEVCYKDSLLAAGAEAILLAPQTALGDVRLPAGDFWIFDNQHVLQWEYHQTSGALTGGTMWDQATGDDISYFLELRTTLLRIAKPL